jgi:hypothetical protein
MEKIGPLFDLISKGGSAKPDFNIPSVNELPNFAKGIMDKYTSQLQGSNNNTKIESYDLKGETKKSSKDLSKKGTIYYDMKSKGNIERNSDSSGRMTNKKAKDTLYNN